MLRMAAFGMLLLVACGPGTHERDAGSSSPMDGGEIDGGRDAAADQDADTCTDEGRFYCAGAGYQCCGGHWRMFFDGPCWNVQLDGGGPDCTQSPLESGCPCSIEGAQMCRPFRSSVRCQSGQWVAVQYACCS